MSRIDAPSRLQIPSSLADQLGDFRRRVWTTKMTEGIATAVVAVMVAWLVVFTLDRLFDTPRGLLVAIAAVTAGMCLVVPYYFHKWVWRNRHLEQLARLLARRMPRVGDQLLGVLELSHSERELARSRRLCEAAIEQVATDAASRDLTEAAPRTHARSMVLAATVGILVALGLGTLYPLAAQNAWARLAMPWKEIPRYTFAAAQPLPSQVVVAHGEPFKLQLELLPSTEWRPEEATLSIGGQAPLVAQRGEGNAYEFEAPAQIDALPLRIEVGDWKQSVTLQPMLRPELTELNSSVTLPKYLERTEPLALDIRGGSATLVKGSKADITATISRPLASATVGGDKVKVEGDHFVMSVPEQTESNQIEFAWQDEFGLAGKEPFKLSLQVVDDEPPTLACEDLPRRKVVLDSEQLVFKVLVGDDFGVREVGMSWKGLPSELNPEPATGERLLAPGGPSETAMEVTGTFSAKSLGIAPQSIELRIFVSDYFPDRERVESAPYILYVLDPEQHAIWITEQLARWHRQSLEVRDREMRLYETNKQLRELTAEQLDQPETRKQIESQATAERANGRRLAALTSSGEELLRQAARNPEIGVGHLDRWAEMLEVLSDISANRMPTVAELLKEGAQAKPASKVAAKPSPNAGQDRSTPGAGNPSTEKPDDQPKPTIPQIVDAESSQQPAEPGEPSEPQEKNPSNPRLGLPVTTLAGKANSAPPTPAGEKVDQALQAQQDLLAEFEKVANELNDVLANLEGSTLVKRLKAAARKQYAVAGRIADHIDDAYAQKVSADQKRTLKTTFADLASVEEKSMLDVSLIMDDMEAYFERRRLVKFRAVLDEMKEEDVLGGLRQLADDIPREQGLSIAQVEYWSDALDRWAEDIVDPACKGSCPGCRSKGSLPPSIVLEVLKILEGEVNLRDETRVAEQAREALDAADHEEQAIKLAEVQESLGGRVNDVIGRIRELPDAESEFGKELELLGQVELVMDEAATILGEPDTGSRAIAAETEAIELLLQSKRINPNGGGGGGSSPGGGGGGTTKDTALALLGSGLNQQEVREDTGTTQTVGETGRGFPEEFRSGLDEYFHRLEDQSGG